MANFPPVESINAVDTERRARYSRDVVRAGDAVPASTDAYRRLAWVGYDWPTSRKFDPGPDGPFIDRMRRHLGVT